MSMDIFFIFICFSLISVLLDSIIGGVIGYLLCGAETQMADILLGPLILILFELIGIISISPIFIILSIIILRH